MERTVRIAVNEKIVEASGLMTAFAERTGLTGSGPARRYLWTDAFAVCNCLGLAKATGAARWEELAVRLIDQVHDTLGRHRSDDGRSGWLSGLEGSEAEAHPTAGGLRIGKALPERGANDAFDERLEWDRDGQYFHYLTKWMHALDQASRALKRPEFNRWARELAVVAHKAFVYPVADGRERMYWKMSIDLTRPLVPSMGQHDPLDGYVTCAQLRATGRALRPGEDPDLHAETRSFEAMIDSKSLATTDPLGIGGLLMDAIRVAGLIGRDAGVPPRLLKDLLAASLVGVQYHAGTRAHRIVAAQRLAFRELGLAIGLHGVVRLEDNVGEKPDDAMSSRLLSALAQYAELGVALESFWREPGNRQNATWTEHEDINAVMLATSLAPDGILAPFD